MQPRYQYLLDRAEAQFGQCAICWTPTRPPLGLVNAELGHWHCAVDWADEVVVVPKPDGSLGAGTVAELRQAVGTGKPVIWA
jgi:hypothetical protein